ncbi:hypothetical protein OIE75_41375 (plasmid) [Streptomyces sp. NBC_01723]|uniref:hypothetical protein n=1 Tax=Streptomyces sp. NBC_01723 TaxID=2975921 RepID=UPI002E37D2F4|nr:hypothetical protein [Streptomyces sp. NBC_01723]
MGRWRFWTQHALTGVQLHPALPLSQAEFGNELNGPGELRGTLAPRFVKANVDALIPGKAVIYAEADGYLRWGGLIWDLTAQDGEYQIEAAGWSSYLTKRHDTHGELAGRGPYTYTDPCTIIRDVWAYAQEQPDGNLGVVVDSTTSQITVGTPDEPWASHWYETPNLGDHLDDLVSEEGAPQYTNTSRYLTNGTVEKRLKLGYPRLGTRRTDISFRTGVNIIDAPPVTYSGDDFANVIIATGSGEGTATRRAEAPSRDGGLRMESVLALPTVNGTDVLGKRATAELKRRKVMGQVETITIRHHPNAPLGSWQIGDDVPVTVNNQWTSWSGWARILSDSYRPTESPDQAVLTLKRADSFHYGPAEA